MTTRAIIELVVLIGIVIALLAIPDGRPMIKILLVFIGLMVGLAAVGGVHI